MRIKINNEVPPAMKNNKFLKGFLIVTGTVLVLSGIAGIIIKLCCAKDHVLYKTVAEGNNISSLLLGGTMLYVYSRFKKK